LGIRIFSEDALEKEMCNHLFKVIGHPLPFVSPHVARFSTGGTIVLLTPVVRKSCVVDTRQPKLICHLVLFIPKKKVEFWVLEA